MHVANFDFELPPEQIAQEPRPRGGARLLVVDRAAGSWQEMAIADLPSLLTRGDLLVVNDTRVFPARLLGRREPSGGAVECLLVEPAGDDCWQALVHPGQKLKPGSHLVFADAAKAPGVIIRGEVLEQRFFGRRLIRFEVAGASSFDAAVDAIGHVPLPPYIHRPDTTADRERYQTVFARTRGAIAAPTAGLHFSDALLAELAARGVHRAAVTLHVGYGTFQPVRVDMVEDHTVEAERYEISAQSAAAINAALTAKARVVAVGTTTTRALETAVDSPGHVQAGAGITDLFIRPGHRFAAVDALLTNFHLPRSSLLMLVAAFGGRELVLAAYRDAVARGFMFYSYGDAMLIV